MNQQMRTFLRRRTLLWLGSVLGGSRFALAIPKRLAALATEPKPSMPARVARRAVAASAKCQFGVNLCGTEFPTKSVPTAAELVYYRSRGIDIRDPSDSIVYSAHTYADWNEPINGVDRPQMRVLAKYTTG